MSFFWILFISPESQKPGLWAHSSDYTEWDKIVCDVLDIFILSWIKWQQEEHFSCQSHCPLSLNSTQIYVTHFFKEKEILKMQIFMLPIGTADSKTLHPPSSTLHARETIFHKAHVHIFKGTHGRFSHLFQDAFIWYHCGFHSDYSTL